MTTLTEAQLAVRQHMGLSTSDTAVTDAILAKILFSAQRKINAMHDWPWLHKTDATWTALTVDQTVYVPTTDIAADWRKTLHITVDGSQVLRPKQKQDILRYGDQQSGMPLFYAAEGNEIVIAPAPDTAYTVNHEYIYIPAEVTSGATEFEIPEWAIDMLISQACIMVARRLRDSEMAKTFADDFAYSYVILKDDVRRTRQLPTPRHRNDIGWN